MMMKRNDLIHGCVIAGVVLLLLAARAFGDEPQALPAPSVNINTQTVLQIVAVWDKDEVPAGTFAKLSNLIKFSGVWSVRPDKGTSNGGLACLASVATVTWDACQFDLGPAYVCGLGRDDEFYQAIEAAVATKFIGGKIQERLAEAFRDVPVLDLMPRYVDVSGFFCFIGASATLGGPYEWGMSGFIISLGGGGIKFGK